MSPTSRMLALGLPGLLLFACQPIAPQSHPPGIPPALIAEMPFLHIPSGTFRAGTPHQHQSLPFHETNVPAFLLARHPVTEQQLATWQRAMSAPTPPNPSPNLPATQLTLQEARRYAQWLATQTGRPIRLPTEIEWEYAARGAIDQAPYPWGWGTPDQRAHWRAAGPAPVAQYPPNPFGLHDMAGLVYEWCEPSAPLPKGKAVIRGGAWSEHHPSALTVHRRTLIAHNHRGPNIGLRLAADIQESDRVHAACGMRNTKQK